MAGPNSQSTKTPEGSPSLSFGEAVRRYKDGTLDPETKKKMDRMISDCIVSMSQVVTPAIPILAEAARQLKKFAEDLSKNYKSLIEPLLLRSGSWLKQLEHLPPNIRNALVTLGENGWFLDMEMSLPDLWELRDALEGGEISETDEAMAQYFENRLEAIELSIVNQFPKRRTVINAAFAAHLRGEYFLSIPVLLSQTDGICKELIDKHIFLGSHGRPETATYVDSILADPFGAAILSPLTLKLPINQSEKERQNDFSALNRHLVLHGASVDYGTRINSFKAISLLNYVVHALASNQDQETLATNTTPVTPKQDS